MLHDTPINLLLGFVVLHRIGPRRVGLARALAALGAVSVLVGVVPGLAVALTGLLAATALVVEVRWHARQPCDPLGVVQFHGLWHVSAAAWSGGEIP